MLDVQPTRVWHEWEFDGRERRITLCLETSLEMRPGHNGFDANAMDSLILSAAQIMRDSPSPIDGFRIVPCR